MPGFPLAARSEGLSGHTFIVFILKSRVSSLHGLHMGRRRSEITEDGAPDRYEPHVSEDDLDAPSQSKKSRTRNVAGHRYENTKTRRAERDVYWKSWSSGSIHEDKRKKHRSRSIDSRATDEEYYYRSSRRDSHSPSSLTRSERSVAFFKSHS